ncbi:MAG: type II toxin-antitoxin system VapC family toxin [Chloroflexi bacterium]|nr:type II toxin-antitoxin system VapC family toxin [Chloroflexota bacterium]
MAETNWLLDTSILIDILRGRVPARNWVDTLALPARSISVITGAELLAGCRNQREQRAVERELNLYSIVWIDETISQTALDFYKQFHLSHGVGFLDCLIAATAIRHGYRLATLNLRHFTTLPGIQAERPY